MNLSVIIPARNEAECIGSVIRNIQSSLKREAIDYEIVVVDDGSTDGTAEEVRACSEEDPRVRLITNSGPHGYGYAVRCGLEAFSGQAVAIMMGDGSDDPEDLVRYFYILRDKAECAFGSRFIKGSRLIDYPRFKLVINRIANQVIRLLFGIKYNDVTNAFKAYRANVIQGCRPFLSPHFNLTVELPLKAIVRGYTYEVTPISWRQRQIGTSHLHLKEMGSRYLFIMMHIWLEKLLVRKDYHRTD